MRRISLLATVVAAMTAICAIAAGSASATVLCKSAPSNHVCPSADVYPAGTEIKSALSPKYAAVFRTLAGETVASCTTSTMNMTTTSKNEAELTDYSFGSCTYPVTTVGYEGWYGDVSFQWREGTHGGWMGTQNRVVIESPVLEGGRCEYMVWGPAIVGGGSQAVYYEPQWGSGEVALAEWKQGCPLNLELKAIYQISTPTPLYVEQE